MEQKPQQLLDLSPVEKVGSLASRGVGRALTLVPNKELYPGFVGDVSFYGNCVVRTTVAIVLPPKTATAD